MPEDKNKHEIVEENTPHALSVKEVGDKLNTNLSDGLTEDEASKRLKKYGRNVLKDTKEKPLWKLFLDQFRSAIIYLLLAAATVSFIFNEIPEGIAIMVVIILNTAIGFFMEYQARSSMKALKKMDKITASVMRDGRRTEMDAEKLVPGDIVILDEGKLVPADCRVIEENELKLNESALTGESFPVDKQTEPLGEDVQLADRINMVFKGTSVNMGNGSCVVVATGMNTAIGDISEMVGMEDADKIPLNIKLNRLSKQLIWIVLGLAVVYGIAGYFTGQDLMLMIQTSIAWSIAAIPEGLAIVATIALARGMQRLAKVNVVVKKLAAVETLGETTTILTDKTGTLTENKLTVEHIVTGNSDQKAADVELDDKNESLKNLVKVAALCSNAHFNEKDKPSGDTVEVSLLLFLNKLREGLFSEINDKFERIDEDPFDSESKFMATMHKDGGKYYFSIKGAASAVLNRCSQVLTSSGAGNLSEDDKRKWEEKDDELSSGGLKTLAFGYKQSDSKQSLEEGYVFIGLIGFLDPPREDVKDAIKTCRDAGIRVVMITGDHPETSKNIARQVGISDEDNDIAYTGKDLKEFGESGADKIYKASVIARVDPRQKLDILNIFRKHGDIIGVTGDGVNDAPVLKKADIGIAMGKRGSQVAQEYADMVLKDDSFPSIITAIREGRIIFSNIRKFVIYQLSYHLSEILVIAAISFSVFHLPLLPLQLLFLNLLVDVFPALALGVSKGMPNVMQQPPKDPEEPILTKQSWFKISSYGAVMAVWVIAAYFFGRIYLDAEPEITNNIAFFSLALMQLLHVFNMRDNEEPIFNNQVTRNKYIWYAIVFCGIVIISAYFIPGLNTVLSFQPMGTLPWMTVGVTVIIANLSIQLLKSLNILK